MIIKDFLKAIAFGIVIIALAVGIAGTVGFGWEYGKDKFNEDLGSATQQKVVITGTSKALPTYLATTTDPITKDIRIGEDADIFCQNMALTPSSTDSVLEWVYLFSDNGTDWYFERDQQLVSSGVVTHGAGTTTHKWTPAVTDQLSRQDCTSVYGSRLNTKWIRIEYSRSANLSGGTLYSEGFFKADY